MSAAHPGDSDRDTRLNALLLAYLEEIQEGRPPDRGDLVSRHPEFTTELREFFALRDQFGRMAAPLREAALGGASAGARSSSHVGAPAAVAEVPSAVPAVAPAELGQIGEFRLLREIGRGGMGVVYEAHQTSLNRRVALKVLPFAAALDPKQLQRFQHEAQAAAQLHHTNIVPVFAVGHERGVHYYAMQLIEGQSLAALIEELRHQERTPAAPPPETSGLAPASGNRLPPAAEPTGPYPPLALSPEFQRAETGAEHRASFSTDRSTRRHSFFRRVAELALRAAQALEHAHQAGVVHRDIKPANLLVDVRGNLWITDFGLALFQTGAGLTMTGELLGTLRYMSPEQAWARRGEVDHRTDVYSLGITLYELLTLRPAINGLDRQELLTQIAFEEPVSPCRLDRTIPVELETIVLKAIAKEPGDRYATAQEMADDLQRFLDDEPILAKRPSLRERAVKWARRHRSVVVSAVVLMLLCTIGSVISLIVIAREHAQTKAAYERELQKGEEADEQRRRAEASFQQARRAVDFFARVSAEELANKPGSEAVRVKLLRAALDYYEQFIDQHREDAGLQEDLAKSRSRVADILNELEGRPVAVVFLRQECERLEQNVREHHGDFRFRQGLAVIQDKLSFLQGGAPVFLLMEKSVADELKLSPDQQAKAAQLAEQMHQQRHAVFDQFHGLAPDQQRERLEHTIEENQKALDGILTKEQVKRLKQIDWQLLGPQAFSIPEVGSALGLSNEQEQRIRRIQFEGFPRGGPPPWHGGDPEQARKQIEQLRRDSLRKILVVLSADQKQQWQELIGKSFHGELRFNPAPPPPTPPN